MGNNTTNEQYKGKKTLKEIINYMIENHIRFDYVNGVLSSESFPKEIKGLWYWFGNLLIAKKEMTKAGEMKALETWTFDKEDNLIISKTYEVE